MVQGRSQSRYILTGIDGSVDVLMVKKSSGENHCSNGDDGRRRGCNAPRNSTQAVTEQRATPEDSGGHQQKDYGVQVFIATTSA
jgi:hypothetical protein